jgi:hypothetical protein
MGALVTEDLVVVAVGHLIHMRRLAAEAGAVAALPTRTSPGAAKRQHGALQKRLIHTLKGGEEHRSIRVPKLQIRTRRKAEEHQAGAHLLGHRIHTPRRTRAVVLDQDGAVHHLLGEGRRQNRPLGTRARLRRLTTGGLVQHHRHREAGASRPG